MLMVVLTYNLLHPLNVVEGVRRLALVHVVEEEVWVEVEQDLLGLDVVAVCQASTATTNQWQWKPTCDFTPSIADMDESYEDMGGCTKPELTKQSSRTVCKRDL